MAPVWRPVLQIIRVGGASGPLIALVEEMGHSFLEIKDHLAKHAISPAEPVKVLSAQFSQGKI